MPESVKGLATVNFNLGPRSTPHEVKNLRQSTWQYHRQYGMPVIHKHRFNLRDVKNGIAQTCPYHFDVAYEQDMTNCPFCFGTGILGGYADGVIAWMTFSDAAQTNIRIGQGGILLFDREPQLTAPWLPELGNGDLIITADFEADTFTIEEERDRFVLKEVEPVTMRGFQKKVQTVEYRVNQRSQIDRVPDGDYLYDVPIVFNYENLPPVPNIPPGGDPTDYPNNGNVASWTIGMRLIGDDTAAHTSREVGMRLVGAGTNTAATRGFSIVGVAGGEVDVIFNEN